MNVFQRQTSVYRPVEIVQAGLTTDRADLTIGLAGPIIVPGDRITADNNIPTDTISSFSGSIYTS